MRSGWKLTLKTMAGPNIYSTHQQHHITSTAATEKVKRSTMRGAELCPDLLPEFPLVYRTWLPQLLLVLVALLHTTASCHAVCFFQGTGGAGSVGIGN
jgi:hypothetical protein